MINGEYEFLMPGYVPYLFQNSDGLTGKGRNDMRRAHFGTTPGITHTRDSLVGGRNGPDFVSEIEIRPTGKAQFAGTDEKVRGELDGQTG